MTIRLIPESVVFSIPVFNLVFLFFFHVKIWLHKKGKAKEYVSFGKLHFSIGYLVRQRRTDK